MTVHNVLRPLAFALDVPDTATALHLVALPRLLFAGRERLRVARSIPQGFLYDLRWFLQSRMSVAQAAAALSQLPECAVRWYTQACDLLTFADVVLVSIREQLLPKESNKAAVVWILHAFARTHHS